MVPKTLSLNRLPFFQRTAWICLLSFIAIFGQISPAHADISRLDPSWHTGLTGYTVPAGNDRLLVFVTSTENSGDIDITNVTYGGQTMIMAVEDVAQPTGNASRAEIWYLNEAGVQAATGTTFVVTHSGSPLGQLHAAATFQNVNQSSPIVDTESAIQSSGFTITTPAFNVLGGGMTVAGANHGYGGSYSAWGAAWTEGSDQSPGGMTMATANTTSAYGADGTDIATATHTRDDNRQVIVAASLNPSTTPDIVIDCDFSDWTNGSGTEFVIDDAGGADDWTNPGKLDITRFGIAGNLSDAILVLFGFDDTVFPQASQAATLIDTDLDDNINYFLEAMVSSSGDTVKLYSCDDTLTTECVNPTLSQTYSSPTEYCRGTATGPWDTDTFVEVKVPYSDLVGFTGGELLLTTMYSYNPGQLDNPKDSIFGTTDQDYDDRIEYDTGDGDGQEVPEAGTPSFAGTVYSDEGSTPIGAGTTVTLLINGTVAGTDTTSSYGDYFIIAATNVGDSVLVYIDDNATYQGTTVSVFGGDNLSDLDIYDEHLITRHDNSGSLSNVNMDTAKGGATDGDILYAVSGSNLNVTGSGTELYVPSGHSFIPGGDVTTSSMKSLGTFDGGSGSIDINGTLTVSGGAFTATSGSMNVSGDFAHTAGTFTHNSGTVILDGTAQSISGSTTFNNLSKSVSTAYTLTFEAGSTQSFSGTITLQGASGELLSLRSSSPGTRWNLMVNAGATKSISYVDVQDSDASGSDATHKPINPSNSVNSGNTIDWFPPAPLVTQFHYRWRNDDGGETGNDPSWWDSDYQYRKQLTVTAGSSDVPSDYSVSVTFDHASLVPGKSQIDGDDIRILYWNGASWAELDRALQEGSAWNTGSTIVWFKTQAAISASNSDSNYYLYYDYDLAASPPANKSNIYDFWDDFDDASLEAGWSLDGIGSAAGGSTNESGTVVTISATNTGDIWGLVDNAYHLARSKSGDFVAESYTVGPSGSHDGWSKYGGVHLRDTTAADSKNANMSEVNSSANATHSYRVATGEATAETLSANRYDYNRIIRSGGTAKGYQSNDGVTWSQIGGTVTFTGGLPDPVRIGPILAALSSTAHSVDVDWFKIRLYVDPEPTTSLGVEEPQSSVGATWAAAEDVKLIGLAKQTLKRLRFMISNEGAGSDGGVSYQLHVAETTDPTGVDCPTETYEAVGDAGETHWEIVATDNITEPEATNDIDPGLTNEATTFVSGELKDSGDATGNITLNGDEFTEIEFAIQATTGATDAGEYCFKLVKDGTPDEDLDMYSMYAQVNLAGATAVKLLSFDAKGKGSDVNVTWQTANEINNMGFYLYRADTKDGPFTLLTDKMIPGADFTTLGQQYAYIDREVTRGRMYYYRLVDVDTSGTRTDHGPICVDWDADGLPDDWELAHGLDPTVDDADLDADNDGLTNLEEYARGSDPNNPDSDGDGILDGDEHFQSGIADAGGSLSLSRGVHILASDETGITLELRTEAFETAITQVGAEQFEKLSVKEYVHGYNSEVGKPRLPLKGILLDIPAGQSAHVTVLDTASTIGYGYQVYPVPQNFADEQSYTVQVAELFTMDADAYQQDAFYPASVVGLGEVYNFRDQLKQQLIFYPLSFNPVSGQVRHYSRIRVRIDYEDADLAKASNAGPQPWVPPSGNKILNHPIPMGPTAMAFIGPTFLNSPLISAIASLGTLVQAAWMPPGFDWSTQGPAYKVLVAEAGLYRLTGSYLDASGVNLAGVNIEQVRLYNLGTEIAVTVYDENGDNLFDGSDYIEFYATAVDSGYAKYTNNNVYWLTLAGGLGAPLRMGVVDGAPAAGPDTAVHYFTVHYEPDDGYWQEAPGADSLDRWFIGAIALGDEINSVNAGQPVSFDLPLVDVVDSPTGTLKIMLYGGYDTDHEVQVSYEGEDLGTFAWSGYTGFEVIIEDVDFSEQTNDGKYTVSVTCLSGFDKIAFDWIKATYPRKFVATDDSLRFTHDSGYLYTIDDFSTDELMVLDITDTDDPIRVQGFDIYDPVASSFSLEFETPDDGQAHTYLVLAEAQVKTTAAAVVEDNASDLAETAKGADYILITHGDIGWDGSGQPRPWVDELVTLREAQGLRVQVVNVQDIYDEFSYGLITPQAIKDFLTYAYENWSPPAPQYVVFVGDSSYDYKDNWKLGTINHVPSYLTYTEFMGETVTDEWFVTVNGDDAAADMYIGRLPAQSAAEAQVMVAKIMAYETEPNTKSWEKNILLVADDQEEAFESVFKTMNEDAAALLPTGMEAPYKGYLQDYLDAGFSPVDLNSDILDQINAGALIANFSGHGHLQGWASESIFDAGDIDALTNAGKYPFIVSMNCLTGYFAYPDPSPLAVSFAELLLRAVEKGTAAALMPTGMTTTEGQHVMNTALFETIFVEDIRKLGPAIARSKRELLANGDAYFEQVSQTFLLFGDPAMQLRVPLPRRPAGLVPAFWTKIGVALSWGETTDCNNDPVAGYNVYRSTSPTGSFTKINTAAITEEEYTDNTASAAAAAASAIYYYTVTAVDTDGDESIASAMVASPNLAAGTAIVSGGSGGGGGGCFVSAAANSFKLADIQTAAIYWVLMVCGVLALLIRLRRTRV